MEKENQETIKIPIIREVEIVDLFFDTIAISGRDWYIYFTDGKGNRAKIKIDQVDINAMYNLTKNWQTVETTQ